MRNVILQVCTRNGQIEKHNCGAVKKSEDCVYISKMKEFVQENCSNQSLISHFEDYDVQQQCNRRQKV